MYWLQNHKRYISGPDMDLYHFLIEECFDLPYILDILSTRIIYSLVSHLSKSVFMFARFLS